MISIYIVTYKNSFDLNKNLESIFSSDVVNHTFFVNIINNHSDFYIDPKFESNVKIFHNALRPDFSTGHLARNWNQAIIDGFKDLNNPFSDIVLTVQDDVVFHPDWYGKLLKLHEKYSFITMGTGDAFCSYQAQAVKRIGLWDERFCNIGFQEADYFLRALIYNRELSSINDPAHMRLLNPIDGNRVFDYDSRRLESTDQLTRMETALISIPATNNNRKEATFETLKFHSISRSVFYYKWGINIEPAPWGDTTLHSSLKNTKSANFVFYPYFEKDVEELIEKNYVITSSTEKKMEIDFHTVENSTGDNSQRDSFLKRLFTRLKIKSKST